MKFIEKESFKLLKMNDLNYPCKLLHDEWFKLSIRFIEDLLKINDSNYWRWMIQIIEDERFRLSIRFIDDDLLKMND